MKKYLGIICLVYSILIIIVCYYNLLKNFLAPNMHIYIKISCLMFLIMGLVLLVNSNIKYNFKKIDLILLLPIIMLILSGNGRLDERLASNRIISNPKKNISKQSVIIEEKTFDTTKEEIDFTNPYFEINDKNYNELSNYISYIDKAVKFIGKTIKVRGFVIKNESYIPKGYFILGKYSISCCAADANFTGFYVKNNKLNVKSYNWYEIEGILEKAIDTNGNNTLAINVVNIKEIDEKNEEQYVYPCYTYDQSCSEVLKYDLEY